MAGVKVIVPDHARTRIIERGGDGVAVTAAVSRAIRQMAPSPHRRFLAVDCPDILPEVVPIVQLRPQRPGQPARAVVKTVLHFSAASLAHIEVVYV